MNGYDPGYGGFLFSQYALSSLQKYVQLPSTFHIFFHDLIIPRIPQSVPDSHSLPSNRKNSS